MDTKDYVFKGKKIDNKYQKGKIKDVDQKLDSKKQRKK